MAVTICEWFGYDVQDWSPDAVSARAQRQCPFINSSCTKRFHDNTSSGVCSVHAGGVGGGPVIICPNRLYASGYSMLEEVASIVFGPGHAIVHPNAYKTVKHNGRYVVAFGRQYGKELKLPRVGGRGGYFVDWILARIGAAGSLAEFVAVEVQTIDTTGQYRSEVLELRKGRRQVGSSKAGLNWENVNKRILPQLIYKGHVLRREPLCTKGLFFVCPAEVYNRISARLGGVLLAYNNLQPGSIAFLWYGLDAPPSAGTRPLRRDGEFRTTVDQVALGFTAPANLPPAGVYEAAIRRELG